MGDDKNKSDFGVKINPEYKKSKADYKFDFNSDEWQIDGSKTLRFVRLKGMDSGTKFGFRQALSRYAEEMSASHTSNIFTYFNMYFKHTGEKTINVLGLSNYRASLDKRNEYKLGALKGFLITWYERGFQGVDKDVASYLKMLTLKGNDKGKAVRKSCPYDGALTMNELGAIIDWASNAFNKNVISLRGYAILMSLIFTGKRTVQFRYLRGKDLSAREDSKGADYVLTYPLAKQRGSGFRDHFKTMDINEDFYLILKAQWKSSVKFIEENNSLSIPLELQGDIPVFLDLERSSLLNGIDGFKEATRKNSDWLHMTEQDAIYLIQEVSGKNTARSERTKDKIGKKTEITYFKSKAELTGEKNLADFIDHCKNNLDIYEDQGGWKADSWRTVNDNKGIPIRFSRHGESTGKKFKKLSEHFLSFAKAYMRYTQTHEEVTSVDHKLVVLRNLHDALIEVHQIADILKTDGIVINKLDELIRARVGNLERRNKVGYQIEALFEFISIEQIFVPALQRWKNPYPKQAPKAERTDEESRKWQDERMPSMHQMLALAECFAKAETTEDIYWSSINVLLMFSPGRAGEIRDLTTDCLHHTESGKLGVRWYSEKGFGDTIKWVPECLAPSVLDAHNRLLSISQPARDAAKFAYDHPDTFFRHEKCITPKGFKEDTSLNVHQFACAMGFKDSSIEKIIKKDEPETQWGILNAKNSQWIIDLREKRDPSYRDLAKYVAQKYKKKHWPLLPSVDRPIWESLVLRRENEFHNTTPVKPFSWCLPTVNNINDQLAPRKNLENPIKTLFQRMGYDDEDGSPIALSSHQPRVWITTNAHRGGMDEWLLARWAGRANIKDNRHYDFRTSEEKEEQVKSILEFNERPTALEAINENLPVSYNDLGINRIGIADITLFGMCVHDYAMSPCTKGGGSGCMTCKEHVCIKGMPKTLERIKLLEKLIAGQLEKAKEAANSHEFGADRWVTHLGWKLAHITAQRQIMESDETPEGAIIRIPPEHDPSPIKRALGQNGYDTKADEQDLVDESTIRMLLGADDA